MAYGFDVEDRLFEMLKAGETLTEIQWDFYALHAFSWQFSAYRLHGILLSPDCYLFLLLPGAMDRHQMPQSAAILREARSLFPPGTIERGESGVREFLRSLDEAAGDTLARTLSQFDHDLRATGEDFGDAAAAIARERPDELPDPQQPLARDDAPDEETINPSPPSR